MEFVHSKYRQECPAPGCGKRRRGVVVVAGFHFCDVKCAIRYAEWWERVQEGHRLRLQALKSELKEVNLNV